jgi:hypothetical protein
MEKFENNYKKMPYFAQNQIEQEMINFRQEVELVLF